MAANPRAKKPAKKDGAKNLRYADCSPDIQKRLRGTRAAEWRKWQQFNMVRRQ